MSQRLARARLLLGQSRHDLAEGELRAALAESPESAEAHALLALALAGRRQEAAARREAGEAVRLDPNYPYGHYVLAWVLYRAGRYRQAERAAAEAIRLDPADAGPFALRALIAMGRKRWAEALAFAERGLALDPASVDCLNYRAAALRRLGRRAELEAATAAVLERDPENAFSHAMRGWALLDRGRPAEAMACFREALRLEPGQSWARAGVVEAVKARFPLYRPVLKLMIALSGLDLKRRLGLILGVLAVYWGLCELIDAVPALRFAFWPLSVALFALGIFCGPFSNLILRLHRVGRLALTGDQTAAANWTGPCLLAGLGGIAAYLVTGRPAALQVALAGFAMLAPVIIIFQARPGRERRLLGIIALGLAALGALTAAVAMVGPAVLAELAFAAGWLGFVLYPMVVRLVRGS